MRTMPKTVGVRVDPRREKKLNDLAHALRVSSAEVVRRLIDNAELVDLLPAPAYATDPAGELVELRESAADAPALPVLGASTLEELQARVAKLQGDLAELAKVGGGDG